ncbi:MAG: hypothetical protein PVF65_02595, partial [Sphingomonadales bacterium]
SADISGSTEVLGAIDIPVMMATAGRDYYVQTLVAQNGCDEMQSCELHHYEEAMHCLLEETDEIRGDVMTKMRAFFAQH